MRKIVVVVAASACLMGMVAWAATVTFSFVDATGETVEVVRDLSTVPALPAGMWNDRTRMVQLVGENPESVVAMIERLTGVLELRINGQPLTRALESRLLREAQVVDISLIQNAYADGNPEARAKLEEALALLEEAGVL